MNDKVVVVTGGFGALGRAVGEAALAGGARVALIDLSSSAPDATDCMLPIGGVDLTSEAEAAAVMTRVIDHFGRIDVLANVAGGFRWQTLCDGPLDSWQALFRLNAITCATACKAVLPHLLAAGGGRIVSVGANSALRAVAGMGPYAASKAAVHRLTESLAEELKGEGVTVNAVLPSIIDTVANRAEMPEADHAVWVTAEEVASAMLFLASDAASGITGALLPVTGRV